jgi:hypothetical protein
LEHLAYSSPIRAAFVEAMVKFGFHVCNQSDKLTLFWTIAAPGTVDHLARIEKAAAVRLDFKRDSKISSPSFALAAWERKS